MSVGLAITALVGTLADKFFPDANKKAEIQLEILKMEKNGELEQFKGDLQLALGQIEVNKVEAASDSLFVSGWRPAAGWAAVSGLFYQVLFRPIFGWVADNTLHWSTPPSLEIESLMTLLFGMLGLGAYRTYEKSKGVARG